MNYSNIDLHKYDRAEWYHERIEMQIASFEKELNEDEQMAVMVVLANGHSIAATWFGYHNPNMIVVEGLDSSDRRTKVLVPQTNIQVILTTFKKDTPSEHPKIGFQARI